MNKAQRMVRMVEMMSRRGGVRSTELMNRFELDSRTLRRYIADLRDLGLPINDEGQGEERAYGLDAGYRRAGVQLSLAEVLSLHFGRRLFTFLDGTQFTKDLDDAIERLEPAIPRAQAELARDLDRKFMAVSEHTKDYREMNEVIDEVVSALIYDNPARCEYSRAGGYPQLYEIEPYTLATYRQGLYLFARDRVDGKIKTFAVERFRRFSRVRVERFTRPAEWKPEDELTHAFGIMGGPPAAVVAVFDRAVAPFIKERRWHQSQVLQELADGRVRLRMSVAITQELVTWLLGFAGDVEVEGPTELVDRLRASHQKALARLGQP